MGHRPVRAYTFNINTEPIGMRHALAWGTRNSTCLNFTPNMRTINSRNTLKRASIYHHLCAIRNFFCRLKNHANFTFNGALTSFKNVKCSKHHCNVAVVPTCVHNALVLRNITNLVLFFNRKRIDVSTQSNTRTWHT